MKILFWGTPAYAVASLEALVAAGHTLVGVVTQPDRRRGRGKELQPSPVKASALELGIPVFTPERIRREPACQEQLGALGADAYVVVAFGQILPPEVLQGLFLVADHVPARGFPVDQAAVSGFADVGQLVPHGSGANSPPSLARVRGAQK